MIRDKILRKLEILRRFKSYLKYAVGEILLVLLSILIALQVNNWNETRKTNRKLALEVDNYEKELLTKSRYYQLGTKAHFLLDSVLEYQLLDTVGESINFNTIPARLYFFKHFPTYPEYQTIFFDQNSKLILSNADSFSEKYADFLNAVIRYEYYKNLLMESSQEVSIIKKELRFFLIQNYPKYFDPNPEFYKQFSKSELVEKYRLYLDIYRETLLRQGDITLSLNATHALILSQIFKLSPDFSNAKLEDLFVSLGYVKVPKLEKLKTDITNFRFNPILILYNPKDLEIIISSGDEYSDSLTNVNLISKFGNFYYYRLFKNSSFFRVKASDGSVSDYAYSRLNYLIIE